MNDIKPFEDILCVFNPSPASQRALERAVTLTENNQAKLTVIDVIRRITADVKMPDDGPISSDLQAAMKSEHAQTLESLIESYRKLQRIGTQVVTLEDQS